MRTTINWFATACLMAVCLGAIAVPSAAQLRVGAARVEITPDAAQLPEPFLAIHDPLYTRAIVIDNGKSRALLMNLDLGKLNERLLKQYAAEISTRFSIPVDQMVISAVHDHASVPDLGAASPGGEIVNGVPKLSPQIEAFIQKVHTGMLAAVEQAQANLEPAEIGFGQGKLYLNVNRDAINPQTRLWFEGPNLDYPSDKTLYVLEFRKPGTEQPIAVYISYAMHSVTMFLRREISGDFPEATEKYLENTFGNKMVAMWAVGPAGDQDPLYLRPIWAIGEAQVKAETDPGDPNDAGPARMRLFFGGTRRPPAQIDPKLAAQSWQMVEAIGAISAEEAIRVMGTIEHFTQNAVIQGASRTVSCPTRKRNPDGSFADGSAPAEIFTGALRLGDVAIARTDSEIYNKIGLEVRDGSPFQHTMVINLANGSGGYILTDDAYGRGSFQAVGNRIKPGCAETGIVKAIDGILYQFLEAPPAK